MKNKLFWITNLIVISLLLSSCGMPGQEQEPASAPQSTAISNFNLRDDIIGASAEVVAGKYANLSFTFGGPNVNVNVQVGDYVKKNQILASFPENSLPQAIINAKADLIIAQDALGKLLEIDTARAQAVIALRNAQVAYEDAVDYRESLDQEITYREVSTKVQNTPYGKIEVPKVIEYQGFATEEEKEKADEALALSKAVLDEAQRTIDRLDNIQDTPDVLAAKTRVTAIEAVINQSMLIAPFDGTIIQKYINSGEVVSPGVPILLLADLSTLQVKTTDLNEVDVARIQVGDEVDVSFDALQDTVVKGKVSEISLKNAAGSGVYYDVFITLDEIPKELLWGMSAFVEIKVSK